MVQDPSFSGPESWKHLPKWGNMPFSGLDSRKDPLLGWMACFSGLESRKPPFNRPPTPPLFKTRVTSHENHTSRGPRSKLFRTRVMKTPPQVRQHAIFKTRLPKRHPLRMDGLFFGTGVTKTIPPNHPHHPFSRLEWWKPSSPGTRSKIFKTRVMKTPPQVRQHAIFKTRLPKRSPLGWMTCFSGLGSRKPPLTNHPPPPLFKTRAMKTIHP